MFAATPKMSVINAAPGKEATGMVEVTDFPSAASA